MVEGSGVDFDQYLARAGFRRGDVGYLYNPRSTVLSENGGFHRSCSGSLFCVSP
jgi:hypothetical protein